MQTAASSDYLSPVSLFLFNSSLFHFFTRSLVVCRMSSVVCRLSSSDLSHIRAKIPPILRAIERKEKT